MMPIAEPVSGDYLMLMPAMMPFSADAASLSDFARCCQMPPQPCLMPPTISLPLRFEFFMPVHFFITLRQIFADATHAFAFADGLIAVTLPC